MNKIRELRLKRNLRQQDLAKQLNVTREAVTQWENGKCFPRKNTLVKLVEILNCTPNDLF